MTAAADEAGLSATDAAALIKIRRVGVCGGEIEADIAGGAHGGSAPILLLHGWALDRRMWRAQVPAFAAGRLVVAMDRRGSGASSAPIDFAREAEDVAAVLDHVGAEAAVIVGMSQAGRVAAAFALAHPSRTAGVVFQGARLGSIAAKAPADIPISDYVGLVRAGRLDEMKALWRDHPLMRLTNAAHQPLVDRMLDAYSGADAGAPPPPNFSDAELASIAAPALLLTGADDTPLRRRIADHLAAVIPGAERIDIPGAGHLCNLCASAAFNDALERFLARVDARLRARTP